MKRKTLIVSVVIAILALVLVLAGAARAGVSNDSR